MSKTPIKSEQWYALFVFHPDPKDRLTEPAFGEILRMSHSDASDFIMRVADRTDHPYRLPIANELEFALGRGSSRQYLWAVQTGDSMQSPDWRERKPVFVARSLPEPVQNAGGEVSLSEFVLGEVDSTQEHICIYLADLHGTRDEDIALARLAKPIAGKMTVQFLLESTDEGYSVFNMLREDMQRILIDRGRTHPWRYAVANCQARPDIEPSQRLLGLRTVYWRYQPISKE